MISRSSILISSFAVILGLSACTSAEKKQAEEQARARDAAIQAEREAEARIFTQLRPEELRNLAQEAVIYGFPLVVMDITRQVERAPSNQFRHEREFSDASRRDLPNTDRDVLYSTAWLDLSREPVVLSLPAMGKRHYSLSILDAWSNVFAAPGTRTTGNGAGQFVLVGPDWQGSLPSHLRKIQAPTNMVWIIGRTQSEGGKDYGRVHALQDRYQLWQLSEYQQPGMARARGVEPAMDSVAILNLKGTPNEIVTAMDGQAFFSRLSRLMKDNPPVTADQVMLEKLARLGVSPGRTVNFAQLPPEVRRSLDEAVRGGYKRVAELGSQTLGRTTNGWSYGVDLGSYGNDYEARAAMAWSALGAPMVEDLLAPVARLDREGLPLSGAHRYVLHFTKGQLPPTNGPWSLTMYDARGQFVANSMNRYVLGSKDSFRTHRDGSLTLYIQADPPGRGKAANWLPAPRGEFSLVMRLYWPKQAVLTGEWQVPGVAKVPPTQRLTRRISGR